MFIRNMRLAGKDKIITDAYYSTYPFLLLSLRTKSRKQANDFKFQVTFWNWCTQRCYL